MNIFQTHLNAQQAADWLCKEHLGKMPLESAQLISTAIHHISGLDRDFLLEHGFYKPSHDTHPSTLWIKHSRANFRWLVAHLRGMQARYTSLGKTHKSFRILTLVEDLIDDLPFPNEDLTPIFLAMDTGQYLDIKSKYSTLHKGLWMSNSLVDGALAYQEYVKRKCFLPTTKYARDNNHLRMPTWIGQPPSWYTSSCDLEFRYGTLLDREARLASLRPGLPLLRDV